MSQTTTPHQKTAPSDLAAAMEGISTHEDIAPLTGNRCECSACGRRFSSVRNFDRHQRLTQDGAVICRDPATLRHKDGTPKYELRRGYWTGTGTWRGPNDTR